ncbi:MAG TPA: porin family protein [Candidatus Bathyarchaeia archaeon]|nr:porin family protein [Candidatus Bathyarchaeia archaeon]
MKKTVLVYAVVLVLTLLAAAPAKGEVTFSLGARAGLSLSKAVWGDDDESEKSILRPTFGVFALVNLTPMLAIQPEIDYLVTGDRWNADGAWQVESFTYLHIPVLLRARLMKEGKTIPFVAVGPAVSVLLRAVDAGEVSTSDFRSTDFGGEAGAGVEIAAKRMKVFLEARFYLGFTNTFDAFDLLRMKNRSLSLTAGLIF